MHYNARTQYHAKAYTILTPFFSCTLAALALVRILYIEDDDHEEDDNDDDNNEIMGPHDL